jgi:hypothetical protein
MLIRYESESDAWTAEYARKSTRRTHTLVAVRLCGKFHACVDEKPIHGSYASFHEAIEAARAWVDTNAVQERRQSYEGAVAPTRTRSGKVLTSIAAAVFVLVATPFAATNLNENSTTKSAEINSEQPEQRRPHIQSAALRRLAAVVPPPDTSAKRQTMVDFVANAVPRIPAPERRPAAVALDAPVLMPAKRPQTKQEDHEFGKPYLPPASKRYRPRRSEQAAPPSERAYRVPQRHRRAVVGHVRCRIRGRSEWCPIYRSKRARGREKTLSFRRYGGPIKVSQGSVWGRCRIRGRSEWCRMRR